MSAVQYSEFVGPHLMDESGEGEDWSPAYYYVSAFCPVFGDDLVVARFDWDNSSPESEHYQEQARLLGAKFVEAMNG